MEDTRTASQLLFDERQKADQIRRHTEGREALTHFWWVLLVIVLTLAAATLLARR